jgi:hypothetical protein
MDTPGFEQELAAYHRLPYIASILPVSLAALASAYPGVPRAVLSAAAIGAGVFWLLVTYFVGVAPRYPRNFINLQSCAAFAAIIGLGATLVSYSFSVSIPVGVIACAASGLAPLLVTASAIWLLRMVSGASADPSMSAPKFVRWGATDGMRLARTVRPFLSNHLQYTPQEFVQAAEKAAVQHPNEWVVFYSAADKYMAIGQYARALQCAKRATELRPNDIRSAYALATAYNVITRGEWESRKDELAPILSLLMPLAGPDLFDPTRSRTEMEEMGMVVDTAAAQALRWFERALELRPDSQSRAQIKQDLQALYNRFPHLRH